MGSRSIGSTIVGIALLALGGALLLEARRELAILYPLEGHALSTNAPIELPFRPQVTFEYQVQLWGHYPDTPLDDVRVRLNAGIGREREDPGRWIDFSWEIVRGDEVIQRADMADVHGYSVSGRHLSPHWHPIRLEQGVDYLLRVQPPAKDPDFYASNPKVQVTIGEEFWQDSGLGGAGILRRFARGVLVVGALLCGVGLFRYQSTGKLERTQLHNA